MSTSYQQFPPCHFHGIVLVRAAQVNGPPQLRAIDADAGRCGLISTAYAPCAMEMDLKRPCWEECQRNPEVNGTLIFERINRSSRGVV